MSRDVGPDLCYALRPRCLCIPFCLIERSPGQSCKAVRLFHNASQRVRALQNHEKDEVLMYGPHLTVGRDALGSSDLSFYRASPFLACCYLLALRMGVPILLWAFFASSVKWVVRSRHSLAPFQSGCCHIPSCTSFSHIHGFVSH